MLPFFLASFVTKMIEMLVYGDSYFFSPTYQWLTILLVAIVLLAGGYSVYLLYKTSIKIKKTKKRRSILFFIVVPIIIILLTHAHSISEAFDPLSEPLDYNNQGMMHMNEGNFDAAEESFTKAIESINHKNKDEIVTAHINLATIYQNKGDIESAKSTYEKALEYLTEADAQYFAVSGILEMFNNDVRDAIGLFNKALEIDPQNHTADNYLGLIYLGQMGAEYADPAKAFTHNLNLYKKDPSDPVGLQNLALNYFQLGQFEDAMTLFEQLIEVMPNNPLVQYFLGVSYYRLGYTNDAIILLESATEIAPELLTEEIVNILEGKQDE